MKTEEAIKLVFEGKKMRRRSWKNKTYYLDKDDEDQKRDPVLSLNDFNKNDWEEYKISRRKDVK